MSAFRTIDIMWMISSVNINSINIKWYLAESENGLSEPWSLFQHFVSKFRPLGV